jgi:hypothetical protein
VHRPALLAVLVAAIAATLLAAPDARAHAGAGTATDYRIAGATPRPAGLPVQVDALGGDDRLRLRWRGPGELVVLGYAGEPYLRLTPDGAWENTRSPSVAPNADRFGAVVIDRQAARAAPEWRRVADRPVVVWHDHRAHWMSRSPPAAVRADPGVPRVVQRWEVPIRVDGRAAVVTGRLDWVPRPATAWWVAGLLALAGALALGAARLAEPRAAALARGAALAAVGAGSALGVADALAAPREGFTTGIAPSIPPALQVALWVLAPVAAVTAWLAARRRTPAAEAAVLAGAAWLVGGAALLGRLGVLWHAVVPSELPATWSRVLVAVGLACLPAPAVWAWRQAGAVRRRGRAAVRRAAGAPEPSG